MQPPTEYVHLGWRPQLDALRCFAVSAVLVSHYVHLDDLPAGGLGVELFFAISGFLITSLLLEARTAAAPQGAAAVRFAWRNFVIRRALRIFPIYYVVITAAALCCDAVRAQWVWHATFSSNYLQFLEGGWGDASVAHCWSLCVEEQFYLFWPVVVLLLPRRCFLPIVVAMTAFGFACNQGWVLEAVLPALDLPEPVFRDTLPCRALPMIGMGALLAWRHHHGLGITRPSGALSLFALAWLLLHGGGAAAALPDPMASLLSLLSSGILIASGVHGSLGRVADLSLVRYAGKISYGIYLYHMPVLLVVSYFMADTGLAPRAEKGVIALVSTLTTFAVAAASWRFFESPINRWKSRFPYIRT